MSRVADVRTGRLHASTLETVDGVYIAHSKSPTDGSFFFYPRRASGKRHKLNSYHLLNPVVFRLGSGLSVGSMQSAERKIQLCVSPMSLDLVQGWNE